MVNLSKRSWGPDTKSLAYGIELLRCLSFYSSSQFANLFNDSLLREHWAINKNRRLAAKLKRQATQEPNVICKAFRNITLYIFEDNFVQRSPGNSILEKASVREKASVSATVSVPTNAVQGKSVYRTGLC